MKAGLAGKPHDKYYSSDSKESAYNMGDLGSIPGLGSFPEKERQPTSVFWPGKSHGQRSLVQYSP